MHKYYNFVWSSDYQICDCDEETMWLRRDSILSEGYKIQEKNVTIWITNQNPYFPVWCFLSREFLNSTYTCISILQYNSKSFNYLIKTPTIKRQQPNFGRYWNKQIKYA